MGGQPHDGQPSGTSVSLLRAVQKPSVVRVRSPERAANRASAASYRKVTRLLRNPARSHSWWPSASSSRPCSTRPVLDRMKARTALRSTSTSGYDEE